MLVPFPEYLPDQSDFDNPGSGTILNVYPRTAQSYGPIAGLSTALNALAARCQGAVGAKDSASNTYAFAGTASKLYQATSAASTWSDSSKGGGYSCATDEQWNFAQFSDTFLACQISDNIQSVTLGSATFADLSAAAPKARYMCVSKDFLLVGNTSDATNGARPQRVWWPAIGDPTNWPTLGTTSAAAVQSDAQDIVGTQGWLTGLVGNVGPADALVFFEKAVFRAMYVGAPDIWGFYPFNGVRGCPVAGSIQNTELGVIYLGPDGFYLNNGQAPLGIGFGKVDKTIWSDIDQSALARCFSALDPLNKLYYFAYPSVNGNSNIDSILVCNYALPSVLGTPGRWAKIKDAGVTGECIFISSSFGYNVDTADNSGFNVDSSPYGPDSRFWTGGQDQLTFFDTAHTANYFNGSNLGATLETSERQFIPGRRARVIQCRPEIDGGSPTVTPITRNRLEDPLSTGSTSSMNADGYCPLNSDAFFHRFQVAIPSGTIFNHASGVVIPDDKLVATGNR